VELVWWILIVVEADQGVFKSEECTRVDVEGEVQVHRPAAALLRVQINLPGLSERISLDKVSLVVHVKTVVYRVVFKVGDKTRNVDGSHWYRD
jgi:hypothetical protein